MCRKDINFQSYPIHLEVSHPEEDSNDRREAGQARLIGGVMVKKVMQEEVKKHEEQDVNDDNITMEDTAGEFTFLLNGLGGGFQTADGQPRGWHVYLVSFQGRTCDIIIVLFLFLCLRRGRIRKSQ